MERCLQVVSCLDMSGGCLVGAKSDSGKICEAYNENVLCYVHVDYKVQPSWHAMGWELEACVHVLGCVKVPKAAHHAL